MNPSELEAQAKAAASQGSALLSQDQAQAKTYGDTYNTQTAAANAANTNLQNYTTAMQGDYNPNTGTGNAGSMYNYELGSLENSAGFDPSQIGAANKTLSGLTGALNAATSSFNTPGGVGAYGLTAPAIASYASSVLNPLQTGVSTANTTVGNLNNELNTFITGASQFTSAGVQGEQNTVGALQDIYTNANTAAQNALSQMQFYAGLAQTQGKLNADEASSYASALQAYQTAQEAVAQAAYYMAQVPGLQAVSTAEQNQLKAGTTAPNNNGSTGISITQPASQGIKIQGSTAKPQSTIPIGALQGGGFNLQGGGGISLQ